MPDIDIDAPPKIELPVPDVKNDIPNKFWASVEPYCSEITTSDIQVISKLVVYRLSAKTSY